VAREGTRPALVVEMVSPDTRENDVTHKVRLYHRAGVPDYVIIDQQREGGPRRLLHYRHAPAGYEEVPPDAQGRVPLAAVGLLLGLRDNALVCHDAATGEELREYAQEFRAREQAERQGREDAAARE